jgi:phosphatidylinositol alpha-mannosyltransferase
MRVGLVSPYDLSAPGGVQAQVLGLGERLRALGDDVQVIGPRLPPDVDGFDLGETVKVPGNGSMAPIAIDPRVGRRMKEAVAGLDVLHVHEPFMPMVSLAALRSGPPVLATFHADPSNVVRTLYRNAPYMSKALGNTRAITAVSETAASALPESWEVAVIPNGVDVPKGVDVSALPKGVGRSTRRVSFLGRDERRKGLSVLLEAWSTVSEIVKDAELVVMGAVRQGSDVEWMGRVGDEQKFETLANSAVYVAPNLGGESFGIILVEAMAAGAPVIASDLKAFRDVAGDAARYFPVGDPAALAGELADLLLDDQERERLSTLGFERAKLFSWDAVVTQYRDTYISILS